MSKILIMTGVVPWDLCMTLATPTAHLSTPSHLFILPLSLLADHHHPAQPMLLPLGLLGSCSGLKVHS